LGVDRINLSKNTGINLKELGVIKTERIYNVPKYGGFRILVDRLWPRGLAKEEVDVDLWLKDIGPSNELRKWFGHDPGKWDVFRKRFFQELDQKRELVDLIIAKSREQDVTLLFGAKDEVHNNAVALKEYIESR
jgi:uncharacterized protein YeaO (DUF488 family)